MLRISHLPGNRDAPVGPTFAGRTIGTMLHNLFDAICEGLAAHREYEGLVAMGVRHDTALRAALSLSRASIGRPTANSQALSLLIARITPLMSPARPGRMETQRRAWRT
jgi:hypothetical protein